ncbi:hypothetical protein EDB92DRAFT_1815139 [Lactarius akahatsu]|uniref:Uncharacterized protein n=1 Tax=Lactarius akahatsu TaxID=416441 RepID=A0AAD4LIP1_9AGAM|nr:hypothetical protein EDB92DRAFT_1815139 [Lactarius akahatsu]
MTRADDLHQNNTCPFLLRGSVPESARGGIDSTYYMHYTAEANRGLGSLGWNKAFSDVHSFVANAKGCTNPHVSLADIPLTNNTGKIPGPLILRVNHGTEHVRRRSSSGSGNGAAGTRVGVVGATVLGALLAGVVTLHLA